MHAISSCRGIRLTNKQTIKPTNKQADRQDRLQYTVPLRLARSVTRSSADADNGLDAFVGQSRSTNILGPFQVK